MVLYHVSQCAALFVITSSFFYADLFSHGYLDRVDKVAVPYRLKQSIGKAERQDILHCFFTEVMIYTVYLVLGEYAPQHLIEVLCSFQIRAKRLFNNDPCIFPVSRKACFSKVFRNSADESRRHCQVKIFAYFFFSFRKSSNGLFYLCIYFFLIEIAPQVLYFFCESIPFCFFCFAPAGKFINACF